MSVFRVVPDFVVQGCVPRGDGRGGSGYEQITTANDERGNCGIASAGKGTEGSQFIITHCSTLHLDGHYTIFSAIVKGMAIVDRLQIGDMIEMAQIVED